MATDNRGAKKMGRDDEARRLQEKRLAAAALRARSERAKAQTAEQDEETDWSLGLALCGGLAVAILANTFIGIIPL